jgi:uncharacterized protein
MRWLVIAASSVALLASGAASSQNSPQAGKHALALELIETTGSLKIIGDIVANSLPRTMETIKRNNPSITDQVLEELRGIGLEVFRDSLPDLADPMAAIYESMFSEDELRQVIEFYRSPLGRKMLEKTPIAIEQGQALGVAWAKKVGASIAARIRSEAAKRGYTI